MIQIVPAHTKKLMHAFAVFPFSLYRNHPFWVPPIISSELASWDKTKNPVFDHAEADFFLAYKEEQIVGRVACIVNHTEVNQQGIAKMRFGWFDFIDDYQVSSALLNHVAEYGRRRGLAFMEGPVGFSNLDKVGVMTSGFDHIGTMITWYNHPYYADHYHRFGMTKEKGYLESKFSLSSIDGDKYNRLAHIVAGRFKLKTLNFKKTAELLPYTDAMFDLFNQTYASLSSFVPISQKEKEYMTKQFIGFINPSYIKFVVDELDKMVGFAITMPSFSKALQKAKGKLFPWGWWHLIQAKKNNPDAVFYLIGVLPEYQNKGVTALLFDAFYKTYLKEGVVNCYRTPELEDNTAIMKLWVDFNPEVHQTRCTFKMDI